MTHFLYMFQEELSRFIIAHISQRGVTVITLSWRPREIAPPAMPEAVSLIVNYTQLCVLITNNSSMLSVSHLASWEPTHVPKSKLYHQICADFFFSEYYTSNLSCSWSSVFSIILYTCILIRFKEWFISRNSKTWNSNWILITSLEF